MRVRTASLQNAYIFLKTEVFVNPKFWNKVTKKVREVKGSNDAAKKKIRLSELMADHRKLIESIQANGGEVSEQTLKGSLEESGRRNLDEFLLWRISKNTGIRESTRKVEMSRMRKVVEFDPKATLDNMVSKRVRGLWTG